MRLTKEQANRKWREENKVERAEYSRRYRADNPWHSTYVNIQKRCENTNSPSYRFYGAKGIKNFLTYEDLKSLWLRDNASEMVRPSIDRIDPKGNYEISNCRYIELLENIKRTYLTTKRILRKECRRGHEYTLENTISDSKGYRKCRTCITAYRKERYLTFERAEAQK